jgi:hypothetical protein
VVAFRPPDCGVGWCGIVGRGAIRGKIWRGRAWLVCGRAGFSAELAAGLAGGLQRRGFRAGGGGGGAGAVYV